MKLKQETITKIYQRRHGVRNIAQKMGKTPATIYNWIASNKPNGPMTTIAMADCLRWLLDVDNGMELYEQTGEEGGQS